jgi:hypothetical protein
MNTHNHSLYSAQDSRNLPEAFRERTLDFYITLCHRLMKQRSELAEETDALLRACWSLAEMLFSLRQNKRDGKAEDDELLGSAVQACWDLCDIFRAGWTQIRPERGTPRPNQVNFFSPGLAGGGAMAHAQADARSQTGSRSSVNSHSKRESLRSLPDSILERGQRVAKATPVVPETPVTEFEDIMGGASPESSSPQAPNLMVLGSSNISEHNGSGGKNSSGRGHWSSSASNLSSYSQSSKRTSSTATTATATAAEDINITRIKVLVVKAAMNIGFSPGDGGILRPGPNSGAGSGGGAAANGPGSGLASLQAFVKSLPTGSFGPLPMHATLLQNYKNLVLADSAFRASSAATGLPMPGRRVSATELAKSVNWMMLRSGQYGFLRELFQLVFRFPLEEADNRKTSTISV